MSTAPKPQPVSADPVHVDSKHYTVEAENDRVRVLRVKYGPREKSVMHRTPVRRCSVSHKQQREVHLPGRTNGRTQLEGGRIHGDAGRGTSCPKT